MTYYFLALVVVTQKVSFVGLSCQFYTNRSGARTCSTADGGKRSTSVLHISGQSQLRGGMGNVQRRHVTTDVSDDKVSKD